MRGHVQKRGKGSWRIYYDEPTTDGSRRQRTLTVRGRKKDAEAKLADILASMGKAEYVEPTKQTVGQYLTTWIGSKRAAPSTLEGYAIIIAKHLKPELGHLPVQMLSYEHVEGYYRRKRETLSEQTLKHHHALLRKALRDATKRKVVPTVHHR